jgi:hypothetical protein
VGTLKPMSYQHPQTGSETDFRPWSDCKDLSFNRTQSRVVTGLFIAHNILKRHCYLKGLANSPNVGVQQRKKPQPMFCVSAKLWLHSDIHICDPFSLTHRARPARRTAVTPP